MDRFAVVRCRDCMWWHTKGCAFRNDCTDDLPSAEDFCSQATRKKERKMTNFERIKAMSIEEVAKLLVQYEDGYGCYYIYGVDEPFCDGRYTYEEVIKKQIEFLESEAEE